MQEDRHLWTTLIRRKESIFGSIQTFQPRKKVGFTRECILHHNWFPKNPYKIKLFINEEEIPLRRYAFYEKEFETSIPYKIGDTWYYDAEPIVTERHAWFWYQIFKPNYFKSGTTYVIRMEVWVHSPYGGSEETGWRIYINYIGPELGYGPHFPEIAGIYERYIHVTD